MNEKSIWHERQNHPELVVQDAVEAFGLDDKQADVMRQILLRRGVNKWLYARRLFIHLKHDVKSMLKESQPKTNNYRILQYINTEMQHIAKMPRWIEWGRRVHRNMKTNEQEIVIRGKSC